MDKEERNVSVTLQLRQIVVEYFRERIFLLALVLILFLMGMIFGVFATGVLDEIKNTV